MKMKHKPAKAKTIGPIAGIPLKVAGYRDGQKGLPKPSAGGEWLSPFMERYNKAFAQRQDEEYRLCAEKTRKLQIKADSLKRQLSRKEALCHVLSAELTNSDPTEEMLAVCYNGEEKLPASGIRARRLKEHQAKWAGKHSQLAATEQFLHNAHAEIATLLAEIVETETDTRLDVERVRANTDARILVYYQAALKAHPQREKMPPCPKLTDTNGEATYLSSRRAEPERITAMQHIRKLMRNGGRENEPV